MVKTSCLFTEGTSRFPESREGERFPADPKSLITSRVSGCLKSLRIFLCRGRTTRFRMNGSGRSRQGLEKLAFGRTLGNLAHTLNITSLRSGDQGFGVCGGSLRGYRNLRTGNRRVENVDCRVLGFRRCSVLLRRLCWSGNRSNV